MKIVLTGGVARPQSYELIGPLATGVLEQVTLDVAFLGVDGLDEVAGATAHHEGEASINRLMVGRPAKVVVAADSSKLGRRAFARICPLGEVDVLVTDTGTPPRTQPGSRTPESTLSPPERVAQPCPRPCRRRRLQSGRARPRGRRDPRVRPAGEAGAEHVAGRRRVRVDHRGGRGPARAQRRAGRRGRRRPGGPVHAGPAGPGGVATGAVAVREDIPTGMTVALSRRRPGHPDRARGGGSLTADDVPAGLLAGPGTCTSAPTSWSRSRSGPAWPVMTAAQAAGATVSLDTNWDPSGRWGDDRLAAALARADLLLPNEAEAVRLSGEPDLAAAVPCYRGRVPAGGQAGRPGALCADGIRQHRVSVPPLAPVDATGAGDCFNAGLIAGLLRGLALPEAAALGCAAGALSTRAPGGTGSAPDLRSALALAGEASVTIPAAGRPASCPGHPGWRVRDQRRSETVVCSWAAEGSPLSALNTRNWPLRCALPRWNVPFTGAGTSYRTRCHRPSHGIDGSTRPSVETSPCEIETVKSLDSHPGSQASRVTSDSEPSRFRWTCFAVFSCATPTGLSCAMATGAAAAVRPARQRERSPAVAHVTGTPDLPGRVSPDRPPARRKAPGTFGANAQAL